MDKDEIEKLNQDQDMGTKNKKTSSDADIKRKVFEMNLAREQRERQKMKQELLKRQVEEEQVGSFLLHSRVTGKALEIGPGTSMHCAYLVQ